MSDSQCAQRFTQPAHLAARHFVVQRDEEMFVELKRPRALLRDVPRALEELRENGRLLLRRALEDGA